MPQHWKKKPSRKQNIPRRRIPLIPLQCTPFGGMRGTHAQPELRSGAGDGTHLTKSGEAEGADRKNSDLVKTPASTMRTEVENENAHPQRHACTENVRPQTQNVDGHLHQLSARRVLGAAACVPPTRSKLRKQKQTLGAVVVRSTNPSRATQNWWTESVRESHFSSTSGLTLLAGNGWPPSFLCANLRFPAWRMDPAASDTAIIAPVWTRWVRSPLPLSHRFHNRFRVVYPGCGPPLSYPKVSLT